MKLVNQFETNSYNALKRQHPLSFLTKHRSIQLWTINLRLAVCFVILILVSCAESKKIKDTTKNPIETISWMQELIKQTKESPFPTKVMISQYTYNGKTVFLVDECYQCPDASSFLYTDKKEKLCTFGGMIPNSNNCPDFNDNATNKKILWKSFE